MGSEGGGKEGLGGCSTRVAGEGRKERMRRKEKEDTGTHMRILSTDVHYYPYFKIIKPNF